MAEEEFNPYHKWLGIPPAEQPPNHYRLLGIELFESDLEVIESAADQRMAHLRTFQGGKNAQLSQKLLNEVSKARICLLKPDSKLAYDESLGIPNHAQDDPAGAPPVQIDKDRPPTRRSSAMMPVAIVAFLMIVGAGTVFAYLKFSGDRDDDSSLTQNDENGDNAKSASETTTDTNNNDNSKEVAKSKSDSQGKKNPDSSGAGSSDNKNSSDPSKDLGKGDDKTEDSDGNSGGSKAKEEETPDKTDPDSSSDKKGSDMTPPKMDEKKGDKDGEQPKKDDSALIIKTKKKETTETVVKSALPPEDRWKPFITLLKKDYDIKDDLSRDARFGLFFKLISDAAEEVRADKAYAQFNLALEEAKILNHAAGVQLYCGEFCERFEFDLDKAQTFYLKSISSKIDSKPHVAKLLVEVQKRIRKSEDDRKYDLAVSLLQAVVKLADEPIGKDIDKSHFELWLAADQQLQRITTALDELEERRKSNQLTPEQHRMLGTYECFVNDSWETGLSHYASCEYKPIVDVARKAKEVNVANVNSIAEIADAWWILSSKADEEEYLFKSRAQHWYDEYQKLVNPTEISKKIQKRIEDLNIGIGLKRLPLARSPSHVLLLNRDREIALGGATAPVHLFMPNAGSIGIVTKEDDLGDISTRMRILRIDTLEDAFDDSSTGHIDHPPLVISGKFGWLRARSGLSVYDLRSLFGNRQNGSSSEINFRTPEPVRAFDIGESGDVFALGGKFIYWWNPQQAWTQKSNSSRKPAQFDSPVSFIPSRIRVIPNSSTIALASSRFLVRVNPVSKGISEIHSTGELNDFDFAANGNAVVTALKNGIRYKAFKGSKNLFFQTSEALKVKFLPNSRFIVSLHDDHSVRIWDTSEKNDDYLIERFDLPDYKCTAFAISPDGSSIALVDETTRVLLLDLYFE